MEDFLGCYKEGAVMKVGVIGTGWGLRLILSLAKLGVVPELVYGHKNRNVLQHLNFTEDVDDVFRKCDAVICAVPPTANLIMTTRAAYYDTALFVEKPMAVSVDDADAIVKAVDKSGMVFAVGDCFCYSDSIDQLGICQVTHAEGRIKRQPPIAKINPFWHLAVHHVALFTLLNADSYAIELVLDRSFESKGHNQIELWDTNGARIIFPITGDHIANELKHFIDCRESGETPLTDAEHGYAVIKQLTERYGTIDQCLGG